MPFAWVEMCFAFLQCGNLSGMSARTHPPTHACEYQLTYACMSRKSRLFVDVRTHPPTPRTHPAHPLTHLLTHPPTLPHRHVRMHAPTFPPTNARKHPHMQAPTLPRTHARIHALASPHPATDMHSHTRTHTHTLTHSSRKDAMYPFLELSWGVDGYPRLARAFVGCRFGI